MLSRLAVVIWVCGAALLTYLSIRQTHASNEDSRTAGVRGSTSREVWSFRRASKPFASFWQHAKSHRQSDGISSEVIDRNQRTLEDSYSAGRTTGQDGQRRAKLAYLILSDGNDIGRLHLLLPEIYHPDNIYLIHVDAKTPVSKVDKIRNLVARNFPAVDGRPSNGRLLDNTVVVSWGGFTLTLACLYGMTAALHWDDTWDYFLNISTADFPVMTQDEVALFLGKYADKGISFLDGEPMRGFEMRWKGYVDDQGLSRAAGGHTHDAMDIIAKIERPYPQRFRLYKGEFWHVLHRSMARYLVASPDNVARSLSAYFTGYRVSDESFFQTVACHPEGYDFPIHRDSLRFSNWNEDHIDEKGRKVDARGQILLHPVDVSETDIERISQSGALFARKFDYVKSHKAYAMMQATLRDETRSWERVGRAHARVGQEALDIDGRANFCDPLGIYHRRQLESSSTGGTERTSQRARRRKAAS